MFVSPSAHCLLVSRDLQGQSGLYITGQGKRTTRTCLILSRRSERGTRGLAVETNRLLTSSWFAVPSDFGLLIRGRRYPLSPFKLPTRLLFAGLFSGTFFAGIDLAVYP